MTHRLNNYLNKLDEFEKELSYFKHNYEELSTDIASKINLEKGIDWLDSINILSFDDALNLIQIYIEKLSLNTIYIPSSYKSISVRINNKDRLKLMYTILTKLKRLSGELSELYSEVEDNIDISLDEYYPFEVEVKDFKLYFSKWANRIIKDISLIAMRDELNVAFKKMNENYIMTYENFLFNLFKKEKEYDPIDYVERELTIILDDINQINLYLSSDKETTENSKITFVKFHKKMMEYSFVIYDKEKREYKFDISSFIKNPKPFVIDKKDNKKFIHFFKDYYEKLVDYHNDIWNSTNRILRNLITPNIRSPFKKDPIINVSNIMKQINEKKRKDNEISIEDKIKYSRIPKDLKEVALSHLKSYTRVKKSRITGLRLHKDIKKKILEKSLPSGFDMGIDKNGYYIHTHRARSKSYENPNKITIKDIKFIDSTG